MDIEQVTPDAGFEFLNPVRLRPEVTFKVYDMQVSRTGSVVQVDRCAVAFDPDAKPCECPTCIAIAADEARWPPIGVVRRGGTDFAADRIRGGYSALVDRVVNRDEH